MACEMTRALASVPALKNRPTAEEDSADWQLALVNASHPVANQPRPELAELERGLMLDTRIVVPARRMLAACRAAGLDPLVTSAWRGRDEQLGILVRKTAALMLKGRTPLAALRLARRLVALPGTSEHELGLALDICSERTGLSAHAEVQAWLVTHAWRFGFIRRYAADKAHITGIGHEPWHFRYVGLDAAREMHATGACLEEYLARRE